MVAAYYPPANRTAQWFGDTYPGVDMGGVEKVLLHTTETGGWPSYGGGASAPQLTYHARLHQWRQHIKCTHSARALRDPSGTAVRENRDKVLQVEIVCSSDRSFASKYGYLHVSDLDNEALRDIAELIVWAGVRLVAAPVWLPYPDSYGNSAARMSGPEYDAFKGVLGHMHASGNTHGDPGAINIDKIMAYARDIAAPAPTPTAPTPRKVTEMIVTKFGRSRYRAIVGDRLVAISEADYERCKAAGIPAPVFDNATLEHFQEQLVSEVDDEPTA